MDTLEEKVGYLVAKIEEQGLSLGEARIDLKRVADRVDRLEVLVTKKFTTAETVLNIFKFLGLAAVALLTFKFGDVTRLWMHFFG